MTDTSNQKASLSTEEAIARSNLPPPHVLVKLDVTPDDFVALQRYVLQQQSWMAFAVWQATLCCILGGIILLSTGVENVSLRTVWVACGLVYLVGTLGYPVVRKQFDQMKLDQIRVEFAQTK